MAILSRMAALALALAPVAGCYAPDLRDCVVRCASAADCGTGQVCGGDGLCAGPAVAGACAAIPDGGADPQPDAPPPDAPPPDAPPDAPAPWVALRIECRSDHGHGGDVVVDGVGRCDGAGPGTTTCVFAIAPGPVTLTAVADDGARFEQWSSDACHDQGSTCVELATPPELVVTAKFKRSDDD